MSDQHTRYWPTSQRVVVLHGDPAVVDDWLRLQRRVHELARDVVDIADEAGLRFGEVEPDGEWIALSHALDELRRTLYELRQITLGRTYEVQT